MLRVSLPRELAKKVGLDGPDDSEKARFLILLELYREGLVSFGRLAEIEEVSPAELLARMALHQTYLNYSIEDLREDRRVL